MTGHHGKRLVHGSGTTPNMAPELHAIKHGLVADKAHDIWVLCDSLYVLLTGDFPWLMAVATDVEGAAFSSVKLRGTWNKYSPPSCRAVPKNAGSHCFARLAQSAGANGNNESISKHLPPLQAKPRRNVNA